MVAGKLSASERRDLGELYGTLGTEANLSMYWNTCPVCGKESVYSNVADRTFHSDGSANRACWVMQLRKEFDLHATARRDGSRIPQ